MKSFKDLTKLLIVLLALPLMSVTTASAFDLQGDEFQQTRSVSIEFHRASITQKSVPWQALLVQNQRTKVVSKSDVIRQVKRNYNAEVLRVSLSQNGRFYKVRVLMPNGKVRNLQVNAQR